MKVQLGTPTAYNYRLPVIRYELSKPCFPELPEKDFVLDYGCGNGANTVLFKDDFKNVLGIDVEKERLVEADNYIKKSSIKNISYQFYEGKKIPLEDGLVDLVTSFEVLEHTEDDRESLQDIFRVIKPGGRFCLSVPNKWYLMETHGFNLPLKDYIPYKRVPFLNWMPKWFYEKYGCARIYRKREIIALLKEAGFNILYTEYIKPPFDIVKNRYIKRVLQTWYRFMPDFMGGSIFIACEKKND